MNPCCDHPPTLHSTSVGCTECLCTVRPAATPYPDGQGRAPGPTSAARAVHDERSGKAATRQATVLNLAAGAGTFGVTWRDVRDHTGWHHGEATSALSHLHGAGKLARLDGKGQQRHGCSAYVLPDLAAGRPTAEHGSMRLRLSAEEVTALTLVVNAAHADPWALTEHQADAVAARVVAAVAVLDAALGRAR